MVVLYYPLSQLITLSTHTQIQSVLRTFWNAKWDATVAHHLATACWQHFPVYIYIYSNILFTLSQTLHTPWVSDSDTSHFDTLRHIWATDLLRLLNWSSSIDLRTDMMLETWSACTNSIYSNCLHILHALRICMWPWGTTYLACVSHVEISAEVKILRCRCRSKQDPGPGFFGGYWKLHHPAATNWKPTDCDITLITMSNIYAQISAATPRLWFSLTRVLCDECPSLAFIPIGNSTWLPVHTT